MKRAVAAFLLAFAPAAYSVAAAVAEPQPVLDPLTGGPALSLQIAQRHAQALQVGAELRRQWLAAGHALDATTTPAISAGKILTPVVDVTKAPAAPAYEITFETGPAGLGYVSITLRADHVTQTVNTDYQATYGAPSAVRGTLVVQVPGSGIGGGGFGLYAASGLWTLEDVTIYDASGNLNFYTGSQLAAIFPKTSLTVVNRATSDTVPPTVSAGRILTPTVRLSSTLPSFLATLSVADNLSGLSFVSVSLSPPGSGISLFAGATASYPFRKGILTVAGILKGQPAGVWTIQGYEACDVAQNCVDDTNAEDVRALFGTTTFSVVE